MNNKIFEFLVTPINDIVEGIEKGNYDNIRYNLETNAESDVHLAEIKNLNKKKKIICLVKIGNVSSENYVARLEKLGLKPCDYAPNYLLGLMKKFSEDAFPKELANRWIIAVEPDPSYDIFDNEGRSDCPLLVTRKNGSRELTYAFPYFEPYPYLVLAERIKKAPQ